MPSPFKVPFIDGVDPNDEQQQAQNPPVDPNKPIPAIGQMGGQGLPDVSGSAGLAPSDRRVISQPEATREDRIAKIQERQAQLNAPHLGQEGSAHPGMGGKILHGLATAGNILGDVFAPNTMALIPGTQLHNDIEKGKLQKEEEGLEAQGTKEAADQEELKSKTNLQGAQAKNQESEATNRDNPTEKYTFQQTDHGLMRIDTKTGQAEPVTYNGQPLNPHEKDTLDPARQQLVDEFQKLHPEASLAQANHYASEALQAPQRPPQIHIETPGEARSGKNDLLKAYQPTLDSAERFNVMTESYEKAIKNHDQQAMLNLLANHLGMTMGLQKGARLTRDIINEAKNSTPWLQGLQAKFDKDGYLSGVTLTPTQMRQMIELGQSRYAEDAKKSRSTAQYLGAKDDGPERSPGTGTKNYYLNLAKGDRGKAMQLMSDDGWTVPNGR